MLSLRGRPHALKQAGGQRAYGFDDDDGGDDDDDGDDISGAEQTDNVTLSKSADHAMNAVREGERAQALQKFRILHRVPSREDEVALPVTP